MTIRYAAICAGAVLAAIAMQGTSAQALTMTECSAKYKAAKDAGSLNGMKWNDFRKAQCGSDAAAPTTTSRRLPRRPQHPSRQQPRRPRPPLRPALPSSRTRSIPNIPKNSAGKARMETCLDQYKANKANNGNGGLKWIEKGGGYYSECNKRLKGAA